MSNINNWARRFRVGLSSASPFSSLGLEWCHVCRSEQDCDTQAHHQGNVYAYKRWCKRCGTPLKVGVYDNVPLIGDGKTMPHSLAQPAALEWVTTPEQDRRGRVRR